MAIEQEPDNSPNMFVLALNSNELRILVQQGKLGDFAQELIRQFPPGLPSSDDELVNIVARGNDLYMITDPSELTPTEQESLIVVSMEYFIGIVDCINLITVVFMSERETSTTKAEPLKHIDTLSGLSNYLFRLILDEKSSHYEYCSSCIKDNKPANLVLYIWENEELRNECIHRLNNRSYAEYIYTDEQLVLNNDRYDEYIYLPVELVESVKLIVNILHRATLVGQN